MTTSMFAAPGRFCRGNLHTHSTLSDGVVEPDEVCRRYKAEGYDFIAITDHFIGLYDYPVADTRAYRDADFTTILGAELHSGAMENGEMWHILAVGLPLDFAPSNAPDSRPRPDQETGPQIAARARAAGAYVTIAHPQWSGMVLEDARSVDAAHAVEIYNHGCAISCDRPDGFHVLDLMLSEGRDLQMIATDDAHFYEPDHFGGWVMVKAAENTPEALLAALKAGHHYASQGPEIRDIIWEKDKVTIKSSAAVTVMVSGHGSANVSRHGPSMTSTEIPLKRFENSDWLRVTVIDSGQKRAWSNPVWRKDLP